MHNIVLSQLEWIVKNPFCKSLMYGEGYNFFTQYAAFSDDIFDGLPVGIQTKLDFDVPYWSACVLHNYKEIWVHCSNCWLGFLDYLDLK